MILSTIYRLLKDISSKPGIELTIHVVDERSSRMRDYYTVAVDKIETLPPYVTIIPVIIGKTFWQSCIYLQPEIPRPLLNKTGMELMNIYKDLTR